MHNSQIKRVFAGIRPSGALHLGNYLGAMKGMLELQSNSSYQTIYCVVDIHAITTPYKVEEMRAFRKEAIIDYLAVGLDPEKSILFFQSNVGEHAEASFYFSTVITMARMQYIPTFKDKAKQYPDHVTMALLNYPLLMAADILLYKAELIPAGADQEPHIEVAREVARKMNEQYGTDFPEPKRLITKGDYVPSLSGEGKMSKSIEGSYIALTDSLEIIRKRLAKVPTDSGHGEIIPTVGGVANLLTLVELFQGVNVCKEYQERYLDSGIKYAELKTALAEAIFKELKPIQEKRKKLEANPDYVERVIREGAEKARAIASKTLDEVKEKMGLK
ncbi:tryptophan--tRNA ligase [Candidatus Beckwithbacteria bacterium RBG_13_42_9]|uniref:Tryptophan--tRNA ligase n=1 Tax=Candidatus Beckwithbacteria bacterium RBG_13_42_9 TaxID=1797457 RepID=A0A1F5E3T4_9BACT|nr:MAG: tryptophan--tRNA ligase [Candidatus Beckwithbacteria bacterium RBG_13_42_9]